MAIGAVAPVGVQQFFDNNGNPLSGGKLWVYLAGTSTPTPAYADVNLTVPLTNPIVLDLAGRAPELFLGSLTYKFVLQTAANVTLWTADNIVTPGALRAVGDVNSLTGVQHDVPVPVGLISLINFTNTAPLTIDGFANGTPGQILLLRAQGSARVDLVNQSSSSSVLQNRLYNFVTSGPTPLVPLQGTAVYVNYAGTGWGLISHEQGAWIVPPYNAANFVALGADWNPAGTWTVEAGDQVSAGYRISGTSLLFSFSIEGSSVAGGPYFLSIKNLPYTVRTAIKGVPAAVVDGALPVQDGFVQLLAGRSDIIIARGGFSPWANTTNATGVYGQVMVDVA